MSKDTILLEVVKDVLYLKFEFSSEMTKESIDGFDNIIGGIGLSSLNKNKSSDHPIRNCILFGCQPCHMRPVLESSYVVALYDPKAWERTKPEGIFYFLFYLLFFFYIFVFKLCFCF